jgi:hypothetical protein
MDDPAYLAGRVALTIPVTTVLGLADRPGELTGIGPVDPNSEANTLIRHRTETCADRHGGLVRHQRTPTTTPTRPATVVVTAAVAVTVAAGESS